MALHNVDKGSINRDSPQPNTHDLRGIDTPRMAHATTSVNPVTDVTSSNGRIQTKNQQVLANDGTANKALMGYQQGLGKWGFFVAKDGVDVNTVADATQFIFNSSQDVFKIVSSGTLTVNSFNTTVGAGSVAIGTSSTTTAHGLGITPAVMGFVTVGSTYYQTPYSNMGIATPPQWIWTTYQLFVDSSLIRFQVTQFLSAIGSGSGYTLSSATTTVKYYIMQETAN